MSEKFEEILNESLERLVLKGEKLESVLQSHPEHIAKLEPLLKTALTVSAGSAVEPGTEFSRKALSQFRSAVVSAQQAPKGKRSLFSWVWRRAWVTAGSLALVLLVAAGTTTFAAARSMPDETLYPIKLASEQVQSAVTPSVLGKAKLQARLAERRIEELSYIIDKDNPELAERLSDKLYAHYTKIENLVQGELEEIPQESKGVGPKPKPKMIPKGDGKKAAELSELRKMLQENNPKHEAALRKIEAKAAKFARPAVRQAIEKSLKGYQRAVTATGDE